MASANEVSPRADRQLLARAPRLGPAATGWPLSSARPPFPVEAPYRAKPDLAKLENQPVLIEDRQWHDWIRDKERMQAADDLLLIDLRLPQHTLIELIGAIKSFFQEYAPHGPIDESGAFPWLGGLRVEDSPLFLEALSLSIQEDFAVMVDTDGTGLSAAVLSVCFPSGWDPREKLGCSMQALHDPVADNQRLQSAMPVMSAAICTKGPFVRYVWTLCGDGARGRKPGMDSTAALTSADQLWFRCERQVTIPLLGKASLFLIRVLIAPFSQVVTSQDRLDQLATALESMSPEMLAYKNLSRARELVITYTFGL